MPKEEKKPPVAVKVIRTEKQSALVEWVDDGMHRAYVPASAVKDDAVSPITLSRGVPYGIPWEKAELSATADALAANLRARGIWTRADLIKSQQSAIAALQQTYRVDLVALNILAAKEE